MAIHESGTADASRCSPFSRKGTLLSSNADDIDEKESGAVVWPIVLMIGCSRRKPIKFVAEVTTPIID